MQVTSHYGCTGSGPGPSYREKYIDYAKRVVKSLWLGLRAKSMRRTTASVTRSRVSLQKIPYAIIVGEKEMENQTINVRSRDKGELGEMNLDTFVSELEEYQK